MSQQHNQGLAYQGTFLEATFVQQIGVPAQEIFTLGQFFLGLQFTINEQWTMNTYHLSGVKEIAINNAEDLCT